MTNEKENELRREIDLAIDALNNRVDSKQLNQMLLLFKKTINLKIPGVNYVKFASGLINNSTRLGIRDKYLVSIADNLLKAGDNLNIGENEDEYNKVFVYLMADKPSIKNPYIGSDGKDYLTIGELQSANIIFEQNNLKR